MVNTAQSWLRISEDSMNNRFLKSLLLLMATLVFSQGGVYLILKYLGIADRVYAKFIINSVFLFATIGCIRLFRSSAEDLGLKIIQPRLKLHIGFSLAIFTLYWLYYMFVVRISGLRPFTTDTIWGLLNYLLVAFTEEIYFRGLLYHIFEQRYSGRVAILMSGLLFGFSHFRQGFGMLPKFFTGWLWGSVRYTTGMITLLIPIHFTYNAVQLLFDGNWVSQSLWANLFPLVELLAAILITTLSNKSNLWIYSWINFEKGSKDNGE